MLPKVNKRAVVILRQQRAFRQLSKPSSPAFHLHQVGSSGNIRYDHRIFFNSYSTSTSANPTERKIPFIHQDAKSGLVPEGHDTENLIRKIFDDDTFWHQFNESSTKSSSFFNYKSTSMGLFMNPYLKRPSGLKEFAAESLGKAQMLVQHMIDDKSEEGYLSYIRNLDRLSDILCRVIDLAEFIRAVHPNKGFINAAQECHQELFHFMNILNTTKELYDKLGFVLNDPVIRSKLTEEEISVGNLLYMDFKRSGIDMDEKTRNDFVDLSQHIAIAGQHFSNGLSNCATDNIIIDKSVYKKGDIGESLMDMIKFDYNGNLKIPVYGRLPYEILRTSPNAVIRERIWSTLNQVPDEQISLLSTFVRYRGVLAHLLGERSYSQYQLTEKMARTPENVMSFLQNLLKEIHNDVLEELKVLYESDSSNHSEKALSLESYKELVKPWDRDYLSTKRSLNQKSKLTEDISCYFSVGVVVQGLSNLFKSIYGITLVPIKAEVGETWSNDVRKFEVVSEEEGVIGIIYLDLFHRKDKTSNPAHFTVCCSRKIYPEELDPNDPFNLKHNTIRTNRSPKTNELFQLPVISLTCNFYQSSKGSKTLLTLSQVETLFHEMGHAMHSMLGRTNLHNVSGTRCATDFVELPSILMEHFAKDPRVLTAFARHHETDEPLSPKLLESYHRENISLEKSETFGQIKMAFLDQLLHSNIVFDQDFDVVNTYHDLEKHFKIFADTKTNWPGKFGHLFSYGSVYYSYLFDRAIAAKIWIHLFEEDPLSRVNGDKFKNEVLKWGGSKNPWELLANVLDEPSLKKGDEEAMKFIGKASNI